MAQTGYSPISLYYSTTASAAPSAGNLVSGELALNITDGILFYKDNAGVVQTLATKVATSGTYTSITLTGGTANGVGYLNGSKQFTTGSALTFDGTNFGVGTATPTVATGSGIQAKNATFASFRATAGAGTGIDFSQDSSGNGYVYNRDSGGIIFGTANAEQMRLTSTGLGIGTSSITARLTVNGNSAFTGSLNATDSLTVTTNSGSNNQQLKIVDTAVGGHNWSIGSGLGATGSLSFYDVTAGAIRATLDSSGNLGLGVTPTNGTGDVKHFEIASGGRFVAAGNNSEVGANYYYDSAYKYITTNAVTRLEMNGGAFKFYNAAAGTAGNAISFTQAMTLDASGNLLWGTTSTGGNNTTGAALIYNGGSSYTSWGHVTGTGSGTGFHQFLYNGGVIGSITQNGTTGVLYNITSDYRLKNVLGEVSGQGERIDALEPVEYEWKSDGSRTRGFLAHKFQEVYPGSVSGEKDAVDAEGKPVYQNMQASTSEVIADLVAELQSLRKRVAQLEGK